MKTIKNLSLALTCSIAVLAMLGSVRADFNISGDISSFNNLNSGVGYKFTYSAAAGSNIKLTNAGGAMPNISAYTGSTSTSNSFYSFCVENNQTIGSGTTYTGQLNYSGNATRNSTGVAMNLGAATLAAKYATGTLAGYNYGTTASASVFQQAMNTLMGSMNVVWSTNTFLSHLLTLNNSESFWKGAYDPSKEYASIGNYSVLIMQVKDSGGANYQDFFYVMRASGGGGTVPEPATVLLWSLGSLGAAGLAWNRRRQLVATN